MKSSFPNRIEKKAIFPLVVVSLFFGIQCARQAMPPGGPEDRTPPKVVRSVPGNGSTHASRSPEITIEFSEPVNHESVSQALFLAPRPSQSPKLKWKHNRLILIFPDSLLPNQTYLISLGTGVRDRHGNPMKETTTIAFSTGARLDNGRIWGQVFGKGSLLNVRVWGYLLRVLAEPDPRKDFPQYVTQCDAKGRFAFGFLSPGRYRLFALIDRDKNDLYNPGYDSFGLPPRDTRVSAADSTDGPIFFRIAVQDTLPPRVVSVFAIDWNHVQLRLSEPVDSLDAARTPNFSVRTGSVELPVECVYRSSVNLSRVVLCTGRQDSSQNYTLKIKGLHDLAGLELDSASAEIQFKGSALPDTVRPQLVRVVPKDSSRDVLPDALLSCIFSKAMDTTSDGIFLFSSRGDSVAGRSFWPQPDRFVFKPRKVLSGNTDFRWVAFPNRLKDRQGNFFRDDSILTVFHVVAYDTLTEISGRVADANSTAKGPLVAQIREVHPPGIQKRATLPGPGPYRFDYLLPGSYVLFAFRDWDKNGRLSPGSLDPFRFSERFLFYPDTVAARSRWPNEGNDLTLPK